MPDITYYAIAASLLLISVLTHKRFLRALEARPYPDPLERYPSVTLIRPIKGLDMEVEENARVGLDTGYPGSVQTLFVLDTEDEPALPLLRKVIEEHERENAPGSAEILICGNPPANRTGKLNAMIAGLGKATCELVAFVDSDIRTDREVLRVTVETLMAEEKTGCAFAPVVVSERTRTISDAATATLMNSIYCPTARIWGQRKNWRFPFILGQFMVFKREAIAAIGGLESTEGQLCDDLYMGQLTHEAGWDNVMAPHANRIIHYGINPKQAYEMYARWITFSRTGFPDLLFFLPVFGVVGFFVASEFTALFLGVTGRFLPALAFTSVMLMINHTMNTVHHALGAAPKPKHHWWGGAISLSLLPWIYFRVYLLQGKIGWRGRDYDLDSGSRLNLGD